ncbi:nucleotidyltransferase domain-containing protein [Lysinibacillus xylanilyticus]|uniref:nucleotidyltransferase domain-containing protein n=1 Tax=Lysinibacillus xylanilyticus TaxID=582475 RepID=UPI0037F7AC67
MSPWRNCVRILNCAVQFIPFKIRDIRRRLYLHSASVWKLTKKEPSAFITSFNGKSLLLNEDKTLFVDDIYIIAPQLLVVYEDLIHIDLFTVKPSEIINKDTMKILFDPNGILIAKQKNTSLSLTPLEFQDAVDDTVWFLYQYYWSAQRGNEIWSVHLLRNSLEHFAKVLLHKYCPERALLGLKTLSNSLPTDPLHEIVDIMNCMSLVTHEMAVKKLVTFFENESHWIFENVPNKEKIKPLWEKIKDLLQ